MEVYCDLSTGEEFFSNAMRPEPVEELGFLETKGGEKIPVLVRCETKETTEGNAGMALPEGEEEGEEEDEKKLDYFWMFPGNETELTEGLLNQKGVTDKSGKKVTPYKAFLQSYFRGFSKSVLKARSKKFPEDSDHHIDEEQLKGALEKLAGWIKDNRKQLQAFGPTAYVQEGPDGKPQVSNLAFIIWQAEAHVYFFRPGFFVTKF